MTVVLRVENTERTDILHALKVWLRDHGEKMSAEAKSGIETLIEKVDVAGSEYLLRDLLESIEWSSFKRAQGVGPHIAGGNGPLTRTCPCCGGIDPYDPHRVDFVIESHGHTEACDLAKALK